MHRHLIVTALASLVVLTASAVAAQSLVAGSASFAVDGSNNVIELDGFVIGAGDVVRITQPAGSRVLLRIDGPLLIDGGALQWDGFLCVSASPPLVVDGLLNGQRDNSVVAGANALILNSAYILTSRDVTAEDFMAGRCGGFPMP